MRLPASLRKILHNLQRQVGSAIRVVCIRGGIAGMCGGAVEHGLDCGEGGCGVGERGDLYRRVCGDCAYGCVGEKAGVSRDYRGNVWDC